MGKRSKSTKPCKHMTNEQITAEIQEEEEVVLNITRKRIRI